MKSIYAKFWKLSDITDDPSTVWHWERAWQDLNWCGNCQTDLVQTDTHTHGRPLPVLVLWIIQIPWLATKLINGHVMCWSFGKAGKRILQTLPSLYLLLSFYLLGSYTHAHTQTHPCWLWWYNNCVFLPGTFPQHLRQMVQVLTGWANTRKTKAAITDWCPDGCVRQRQEIEVTAGGVYPRGWTTRSHKLALKKSW